MSGLYYYCDNCDDYCIVDHRALRGRKEVVEKCPNCAQLVGISVGDEGGHGLRRVGALVALVGVLGFILGRLSGR